MLYERERDHLPINPYQVGFWGLLPEAVASHVSDSGRRRRRILLAEDDPDMRELMATQLFAEGFDVFECADGPELEDELCRSLLDKSGRYDVVITDVRMPGRSGLEVIEELGTHRLPPVLLITAFGDEQLHDEAQAHGILFVLDKPFRIEDLVQRVREAVALSTDREGDLWVE